METPAIYVACLAAYNEGNLHGEWIEDLSDYDSVIERIKKIIKSSPSEDAEEYAIHDISGFEGYDIGEWTSIEDVCLIANLVDEHGELAWEVVSHFGIEPDEVNDFIQNNLASIAKSELDYATELFDELYLNDIPEQVRYYIDYEAFCRDIFINDYTSIEANSECYIFYNY